VAGTVTIRYLGDGHDLFHRKGAKKMIQKNYLCDIFAGAVNIRIGQSKAG
jgi:hypothetical protein